MNVRISSSVPSSYFCRFAFVSFLLALGFAGLLWRSVYLAVIERSFLIRKSNARTLRLLEIPASRGMIQDRNGVPLAISTSVHSVYVDPAIFVPSAGQLALLSHLLHSASSDILAHIQRHKERNFIYLKRNVSPHIMQNIKALGIPGLFFEPAYKRYYPKGGVTAHLLGFTNIDDRGQEGLEVAYDRWLRGTPGKRWVLRDRLGHIVEPIGKEKPAQQGRVLQLSIDERIQYLAYRELRSGIVHSHAKSGSVVVLDPSTGEVLAMVNMPTYNPNGDHKPAIDGRYRNRAITDLFEPGSTMKAFSIASALESGRYTPTTPIDTKPGWLIVEGNRIHDEHINHGVLTVRGVLQKSSNIGVAKMTLSLPGTHFRERLHQFGFGEPTSIDFPGEAAGVLPYHRVWRPFDLATLSFGYGISVTPLQLAQAYAVIAAHGWKYPLSLLKQKAKPVGVRVLDARVADQMLDMLQSVVEFGGTGYRARVQGYSVAGKTGTAYIAGPRGYNQHRYVASFVGVAPVKNPRFVVAVVIKDPDKEHHLGGVVAAPIFSKVMQGILRLSSNSRLDAHPLLSRVS